MRRSSILGALALATAAALPTAPAAVAAPDAPAGRDGCLLRADGAPAGRTPCPGVRPGGLVTTPAANGCSLNFLFADADGTRYIGTAGHCVWDVEHADQTWEPGTGTEAQVAGERVGEVAYAVWDGDLDFALIRLDEGVEASPEMCHFGGPTGLYTEHSPKRLDLRHYGNGQGIGNTHLRSDGVGDGSQDHTVAARSGFAWQTRGRVKTYAALAGFFGDSGSGAIDAHGRAVGVLVHLNTTDEYGNPATIGMSRVDHHLGRAETHLGKTLTLQTAPLRTFALP